MLLLNPQLYINVLLTKLLNQIVILPLMMTPLLITLAKPHIKHMYHELKMSGKIVQ